MRRRISFLVRGDWASCFVRVKAARTGVVNQEREESRIPPIKIPGTIIARVPFNPKEVARRRTKIGPRAIPKFPPTAKTDMPVAFFSPVK